MTLHRLLLCVTLLLCAVVTRAADTKELQALLTHEIIGPRLTLSETQDYLETRLPKMPEVKTASEWDKLAAKLRSDMLERVVYRGEATAWRDAKTKVEWLDTIAGGPGYRIKKLRYEAL